LPSHVRLPSRLSRRLARTGGVPARRGPGLAQVHGSLARVGRAARRAVSAAPAAALRVAHLDTSREWRGGQAQVLMLAEGPARRGISNVLLAPPGPLLERAKSRGIETESWRSAGDLDLCALARAVAILTARPVDVVHC